MSTFADHVVGAARLKPGICEEVEADRKATRQAMLVAAKGERARAQAAAALLRGAGITDVQIVSAHGVLSEHYNPVTKKLALSKPVYASDSIAAVGVATPGAPADSAVSPRRRRSA